MEDLKKERTTGPIEGWNFILKRTDHPVCRLRPDVFVSQHHSILSGRQLAFIDNLSTNAKNSVMVRL